MPKDPDQLLFRVNPSVIKRLDALAAKLANVPAIAAGAGPRAPTRSTASRLALLEGLAILEERYGAKRGKP